MSAGPEELAQAVTRLRRGRLVAFPTETVYGLGADATDADAVARVFEAKGRPAANPLIVHVTDEAMARTCVSAWPDAASKLAARFWPGPLTLVLPKADAIPDIVTAGGSTVAVRSPDHPLTLALIETFGGPIVGPSANVSGAVSPTRAAHVGGVFGDDVAVLDGGPCRVGIESSVVAVDDGAVRVLRLGAVGAAELEAVSGLGVMVEDRRGGAAGSPGRVGPHYRPSARVVLVESLAGLDRVLGAERAVVLGPPGAPVSVDPPHAAIAMPGDAAAYAAELHAALREADTMEAKLIVVVRPPAVGEGGEAAVWTAVAERLARASAF
ncbi:MAG: L-threonylcarbamoyladenylate synthase [Planctomycetota bacterium]